MNSTVIIPNFNGMELLAKNLPSVITAKENKKNNIKEIIIVDDASTDGSVKFLKENFPRKVKIIEREKNKGFAATVNAGVKRATTELVCLINSDVEVSKDFLENMNDNFLDPTIFAVSLHEKGFGGARGKFSNGFIIYEGMTESKIVKESFWASGGSAVFRRKIWIDLGGLDQELLPFYFEDLDVSYRAQKRGYKILWDPRANVIHNHESTYKKLNQSYISRIKERNYLLFNWKNLTSKSLIKKHKQALIRRVLAHPGYLRIVLLALAKWGLVVARRKVETKETTVSDEAIYEKFN